MGISKYVLRRLIEAVITLFIIASLVFVLFRVVPGDPTAAMVDPTFPIEVKEQIRREHGLDKPVGEQYLRYLANLIRGNLGQSFFYAKPVTEVIGDKIWNTLILSFASFVVAYAIGLYLGATTAWKRDSLYERIMVTVQLVFRSAPLFWTGMMFLMVFSFRFGWLPHSGMREPGYPETTLLGKYLSADFLRHLVLPTLTSAAYYAAMPSMLLRNTMLEVMGEDFIEMARAKGLSERRVMYAHAVRNALLPVVTAAAVYIGLAAGGSTVIEYLFSWPGLGREIVLAVQRRDYPVAQGAFLLMGSMVVVMNWLADIIYGYLDPRVSTT